ncbi:MAG: thiol reductant ABC exporter subunit CydC [Cocleimonas sp.]|nr:thiol reductant ABC exporter subunit CydC [Cocleimonas sp.]
MSASPTQTTQAGATTKNQQSDSAVFLRLWRLFKPYWGWMSLGILLALITVLSNVTLMALSGWFITSMAIAGVAGASIDYFSPAAGIRGLAISRTASRYGERVITHEATFRVIAELRHWFYLHLEPLAPAVLQRYHSGDLLSRIRADIDTLENVYIRIIVPVTVAIIACSLFILFLSRYDTLLAIFVLLMFIIAGVITPLWINKLSAKPAKKKVELSSELRTQVIDSVQGMGELLIYGAAPQQIEKVDKLSKQLLTQQSKLASNFALSQSILSLCINIAMLGVVVIAIPLLMREGSITQAGLSSPNLVMLTLFTLASFEAVMALPLAFQTLPETLAAARRIFSLVDAKPQVTEPKADSPTPKNNDIVFNKVSFSYAKNSDKEPNKNVNKSTANVFNDLSFSLPQGKRLGIVGSSGIGKSSIVNLLLRFWEPTSGSITYGGHELSQYKSEDIRQYFSVVTQQSHFFNSTIKSNLRLAKRDASDAEVEQVCRVAQIHDFILSLPEGYETWVGEAGLKLSGGQLKRLTIARALLKDSPVLILDEPGEGLDSQTEKEMLKAVFEYKKENSILLITHRQTGLDAMDEVLIIE